MNELIKRTAPGLAIAGVALSTVWLFDPALHADPQETASASSSDGSTDSGSTDSGSKDSGSTDSGSTDSGSTGGSGSSAATADCSTAEAVTGDAVMTEWGPVQVQMEFASDGSVCSVQAIAYPANDPKSARINARAIPYLDQQAAVLGTSFDSVSGATYTSEAYRQSMQSILDRR